MSPETRLALYMAALFAVGALLVAGAALATTRDRRRPS